MLGKEVKKTISDLIKDRITKINNKVKSIKADKVSKKEPKLSISKQVDNETVYAFDWDKERTDYKLDLTYNTKGKVDHTISYPTGSHQSHVNDGDYIEHVAKDAYLIVEGDTISLTTNDSNQITGDKNTQIDGNYTVKFSGDLKVYTSGTIVTISGGSVTVQCSDLAVTASTIKLTASQTTVTNVVPGGTSGFSCLPICPFTGAPHTIASAP